MERYGDGGSPTSGVRDAPVADRVEKSGAYPPPGSLFLLAQHARMVNLWWSIFTTFSRFFHTIRCLSWDLRIVKSIMSKTINQY